MNQQVPCRCCRYSTVAIGAGACTSALISHRFVPFPFPPPPLHVLHPTHRPWLSAVKPHCVLGTCASVFASPRSPRAPSFTPPLSAPRPLLHSTLLPPLPLSHPPSSRERWQPGHQMHGCLLVGAHQHPLVRPSPAPYSPALDIGSLATSSVSAHTTVLTNPCFASSPSCPHPCPLLRSTPLPAFYSPALGGGSQATTRAGACASGPTPSARSPSASCS